MELRGERYDVVNRQDEVIKTGLLKNELHVNNDITRIVTIYVLDKDNRVYIAQRLANKEVDPMKFEAPAHGRVNSGEDYDTAAHREAKEELFVDLDVIIPVEKYFTAFETNVGLRQHFKTLYIAKTSQDVKFEPKEINTLKSFASFKELFEYFYNNKDIFSNAIELDMNKLKNFLSENALNF